QRDRLFVFASYEGNYPNRQARTQFLGDSTTWPAPLKAQNGELHTSPFRSSLFFGKLTYDPNPQQSLELSANFRHETDVRGFGNIFACQCASFENAENFKNDVRMPIPTSFLKFSAFSKLAHWQAKMLPKPRTSVSCRKLALNSRDCRASTS